MTIFEDIKSIVRKASKYYYQDIEIRKINNSGTNIEIKVSQMYEYVDMSFSKLIAFSNLFGTESIDMSNDAYSGCDSCDFGSSYQIILNINNITKHIEDLSELPISFKSIK